MKKTLLILSFATIVFTIIIGSCKKKSDPAPVANTTPTCTNTGTMTASMDGTSYTASGFNNTLIALTSNGQKARRMDIRATVNGGTLVLSVSNWDWQSPPVNGILSKTYDNDSTSNTSCMNISGSEYCDEMLGTYIKGNLTYMSFDQTLPGNITISSVNATNKTVSGTYNFKVTPVDESDTLTFSGSFANQCYVVY